MTYILRTTNPAWVVAIGEGPRPSVELVSIQRLPPARAVAPELNLLSVPAMGKARAAAEAAGLALDRPDQMYQVGRLLSAPAEVGRG